MMSGFYKYIVFEPIERSTGKVYDEPCHRVLGQRRGPAELGLGGAESLVRAALLPTRITRGGDAMKVLVTGGSGFIGSHVVDRLQARGLEPRIFDLVPSPHHRAADVRDGARRPLRPRRRPRCAPGLRRGRPSRRARRRRPGHEGSRPGRPGQRPRHADAARRRARARDRPLRLREHDLGLRRRRRSRGSRRGHAAAGSRSTSTPPRRSPARCTRRPTRSCTGSSTPSSASASPTGHARGRPRSSPRSPRRRSRASR